MRLGFIGYGSMGKMLIDGFLSRGVVSPQNIIVSTRSPGKLSALVQFQPSIEVAWENRQVAAKCDILFLCVKPMEVQGVLTAIREELLRSNPNVVSIAAGVTLDYLQNLHPGRYSKVIPSLTSETGCGVSLICHGSAVTQDQAGAIETLFRSIGVVKLIDENDFEAAADLTSCAPGLFAEIFRQYAAAGVRHSRLSTADAEEMVVATLYGTAKLLFEGGMKFQEMIDRVATKGGITEAGIHSLGRELPGVCDDVFRATLSKHEMIKARLSDANRG